VEAERRGEGEGWDEEEEVETVAGHAVFTEAAEVMPTASSSSASSSSIL